MERDEKRRKKLSQKLLGAAEDGDLEKVKELVGNGADINYKDEFDQTTALHMAASKGYIDIINFLADNNADMNCCNKWGRTPLHVSVIKYQIEASQKLIDKGTDIDALNVYGCTALHVAGYWVKSVEMSKMLVENKACIYLKDNYGMTPVQLAAQGKNTDVLEFLKAFKDQQSYNIDYDLKRFKMKTEEDFENIVAQGSYKSYESRIYLVGPYNVGKTTIAAVLVNDEIPKERCSTNGIWVHLRRAGMNIEEREWVFFKSDTTKISSVLEGFLMSVNYSEVTPNATVSVNETTASCSTAQSMVFDSELEYKPVRKKPRLETKDIEAFPDDLQVSVTHETNSMTTFTHTHMYNKIKELLKSGKYEETIAPVDIWDFGGQDVYYVSHQLFICYRGTFVLVFNGSNNLNDKLLDVNSHLPGMSDHPTTSVYLLHWVNSIITYCKNTTDGYPKILFVATHKDLVHKDDVETRRREITTSLEILFQGHSYRHHLIFDPLIFVNAKHKSDREMKMLKSQVVSIALSHPECGMKMPIAWITLAVQIALHVEKGKFILTKNELKEINQDDTSMKLDERQLEIFLNIQNGLGKIIYFNVNKLDKYIIINPLCLIQVLKSIVTIREYWPNGPDFSATLRELRSKGIISKVNLIEIWRQEEFKNILPFKDFMINILCHLDILVEQKRYDIDIADQVVDSYFVPSMITTPCKSAWVAEMTSIDKSSCLIYNFDEYIIPTGFSFRILSSCICMWNLKRIEDKIQLFAGCAVFEINQSHDLILFIEKKQILIYLVHGTEKSKILRDVATTIQECLTVSIRKVSELLHSSARTSTSNKKFEIPFTFQLRSTCGCNVDLKNKEIKGAAEDFWKCSKHKVNVDIKQMAIWFPQQMTGEKIYCRHSNVLKESDLHQCPTNKQLACLSRTFSYDTSQKLALHLNVSKDTLQSLADEYKTLKISQDDYKFMLLWEWKVNNRNASLQDILSAFKHIGEDDHTMCKVFIKEDLPKDIAEMPLNDIPTQSFLDDLVNHIGNASLQFAIELGFDIQELEIIRSDFYCNLKHQTREILRRWIRREGASLLSIIEALRQIQRGMDCVYQHYKQH